LQANSVFLLTFLFSELHIPSVCMAELVEDGWEEELAACSQRVLWHKSSGCE